MGKGYLQVELLSAEGALPVSNSVILIKDSDGKIIHQLVTDKNGLTKKIELYAPDKSSTLYPNQPGPYFSTYSVEEIPEGNYRKVLVEGVQIYDTVSSILPIQMQPSVMGETPSENIKIYRIPPNKDLTDMESDAFEND